MRSLASLPPRYTVHPEHMRSLASLPPRYTVHPEHMRSLASLPPRYTVHPEHKKPKTVVHWLGFNHLCVKGLRLG
jgi:hypothetical protein